MINAVKQNIRAAIYTRVSTEDQAREGFSLEAQKDLLRKYAKQNSFEITEEYEDGGFSGTVMERPALQQLLNDARDRRFSILLVYKFDRFFRKNKFFLNTLDELEGLGVSIRSATEPFDSSTPTGKFMLNMIGGVAEWERNTIVERSKMGRQRRYKEGYYAGSPEKKTKFGYDYDKESGKLVINEKEAEVVRFIFNEYVKADSSIVKVAKKLRKNGHKTKTGLDFEPDRIQEILRNEMYTGRWFANHCSNDKELKKKENWISIDVPRIISDDLFDSTQKTLEQRRTYKRREMKYDYLLQGMISCGDCGCAVKGTADKQKSVKNGKKYGPYLTFYYRCTHFVKNRMEKKISCNLRYVKAKILEKLVWGKFEEILNNPSLIEQAVKDKSQLKTKERNKLLKELGKEENRLLKLKKEEQRLIEAYQHEVLTMEQIKVQLEQIKNTRSEIENTREEIKLRLESINSKTDIKNAVSYISKVAKGVGKFNFTTKRRLLQLLNTKLILNINGIVDLFFILPKNPDFSSHLSARPMSWRSAACMWGYFPALF